MIDMIHNGYNFLFNGFLSACWFGRGLLISFKIVEQIVCGLSYQNYNFSPLFLCRCLLANIANNSPQLYRIWVWQTHLETQLKSTDKIKTAMHMKLLFVVWKTRANALNGEASQRQDVHSVISPQLDAAKCWT